MSRALTLAGYAVLAAAIAAYELRARRRGTATFANALALVVRSPAGRVVLLAGWLWFGWHLFVRADR
jgi:hypothetical protein